MKGRSHKYGNASQVKCHGKGYADGGTVKKKKPMKPHVPPKIKDPIPKGEPGGPYTPGAKAARKKAKGYADGGKASKKAGKKPKSSMLGTGMAAKAGQAVSSRQAKIDKALKDAGA